VRKASAAWILARLDVLEIALAIVTSRFALPGVLRDDTAPVRRAQFSTTLRSFVIAAGAFCRASFARSG